MFTTRPFIGAPQVARAAMAWLWRQVRPGDPPSAVSAAALFEDDCLVTQLICGDITGAQYRSAMADLAARAEQR